ncbi:unnamed protein product [Ilex paraguariensis]|uniref:Uncharacterized protein n=1 Tax=Ilex paraguariensis TaxID=185542 RepID=A0ABC8R7E0_9AQUA
MGYGTGSPFVFVLALSNFFKATKACVSSEATSLGLGPAYDLVLGLLLFLGFFLAVGLLVLGLYPGHIRLSLGLYLFFGMCFTVRPLVFGLTRPYETILGSPRVLGYVFSSEATSPWACPGPTRLLSIVLGLSPILGFSSGLVLSSESTSTWAYPCSMRFYLGLHLFLGSPCSPSPLVLGVLWAMGLVCVSPCSWAGLGGDSTCPRARAGPVNCFGHFFLRISSK